MIRLLAILAMLLLAAPAGAQTYTDITYDAATATSGLTITGNDLDAPATPTGWVHGATSVASIPASTPGGCRNLLDATTTQGFIGFNEQQSDHNYLTLEQSMWYITPGTPGTVRIYESGSLVYNTSSPGAQAGDYLAVERNASGTVTYYRYRAGVPTLLYTSATTSTAQIWCNGVLQHSRHLYGAQEWIAQPPEWEDGTASLAAVSVGPYHAVLDWDESSPTTGDSGDDKYALWWKATATAPTSWADVTTGGGWVNTGLTAASMVFEARNCDAQTVRQCGYYLGGLSPSTQYYVCVRGWDNTGDLATAWENTNCTTFTTAADSVATVYDDFSDATLGTGNPGEAFTNTAASGGNVALTGTNLTGTYETGAFDAGAASFWSRWETTQTLTGAAAITFQVEICDPTCAGSYVGPDGTSGTSYDIGDPLAITTGTGQKFAAKFSFSRAISTETAQLNSVAVHANERMRFGKVSAASFGSFSSAFNSSGPGRPTEWTTRTFYLRASDSTTADVWVAECVDSLDTCTWVDSGVQAGGGHSGQDFLIGWHEPEMHAYVGGTTQYREAIVDSQVQGLDWSAAGTAEIYLGCGSGLQGVTFGQYHAEVWAAGTCIPNGNEIRVLHAHPFAGGFDDDTRTFDSSYTVDSDVTSCCTATRMDSPVAATTDYRPSVTYANTALPTLRFAYPTVFDTSTYYWSGWTTPVEITDQPAGYDRFDAGRDGWNDAWVVWQESGVLYGITWDTDGTVGAVGAERALAPASGLMAAAFNPYTDEVIVYYYAGSALRRVAWDLVTGAVADPEVVFATAYDNLYASWSGDRAHGAMYDFTGGAIYTFFEEDLATTPRSSLTRLKITGNKYNPTGLVGLGGHTTVGNVTLAAVQGMDIGQNLTVIKSGVVTDQFRMTYASQHNQAHTAMELGRGPNDGALAWWGAVQGQGKLRETTIPVTDAAFDGSQWRDVPLEVTGEHNYVWARTDQNGDIYYLYTIATGGWVEKFEGQTTTSIGTGASPPVTVPGHGYTTGQSVTLYDTNTTPNIDGTYTITVTGTDTYTVTPAAPVTTGCASACGVSKKWYKLEFVDPPSVAPVGGGNWLTFLDHVVVGNEATGQKTIHVAWHARGPNPSDTEPNGKIQYLVITPGAKDTWSVACADGTAKTTPLKPEDCTSPDSASNYTSETFGQYLDLDASNNAFWAYGDKRTCCTGNLRFIYWNGTAWSTPAILATSGSRPLVAVSGSDVGVCWNNGTNYDGRQSTDGGATFGDTTTYVQAPDGVRQMQVNATSRGAGSGLADISVSLLMDRTHLNVFYDTLAVGELPITGHLLRWWWDDEEE